ncbi:hypothetical protein RJ639_002948 [Escallonia herrerae]|uniref:Reticulon-like protein n=1 Tax=Escallonia herrerae TaxID=1293975 RepID=A0AA88W4Y7_9ASTE|nr:hypothetical protein RJ639_002948 [Escallonia herrerae]
MFYFYAAIEGSSVVFYMEDADSCRSDFYLCYTIVVQGAKNVINACRECKVKRLIYNSTADVVFDGSHDICNGDASVPYASTFDNMWSDLKAQAEVLILFANHIDGLLTCALRPSNVFGPGDKHLVPFLVDIAKSGWLRFIIGSGESMSDFTYVENAAHALVCAEEALCLRMVSVSGKVFFITNIESMKFWDFGSLILEGLGYQRPMFKFSTTMVQYISLLLKQVHSRMNPGRLNHFESVQNIIRLASCTGTFNCSAAEKHIGYTPVVSLEEGIAATIESFSHLAKDSSNARYREFDEQSKVEKLLGSGKVADILLWRDEKISFTYFIALVVLYYWFFLCGRTFVSSAAKLLLLATVALSGYSLLPSEVLGLSVPRLSSSCFEISEKDMQITLTTIANIWSGVRHLTISLSRGEDWNIFFKVAASLYFLKSIVAHSLTDLVVFALVLSFTLFFVYEQYEEEIDRIVEVLCNNTWEAIKLSVRILPVSVTSLLPGCEILHGSGMAYCSEGSKISDS